MLCLKRALKGSPDFTMQISARQPTSSVLILQVYKLKPTRRIILLQNVRLFSILRFTCYWFLFLLKVLILKVVCWIVY